MRGVGKATSATCLILIALATSCDPIGQAKLRLGVLREDDAIVILYVLCPGELVTAVELETFEDGPGSVIWRIESSHGQPATRFVVGEAPRGFVETQASASQLRSGITYALHLDSTTQVIGTTVFELDELKDGVVRRAWQMEYVSVGEFEEQGRDACG